MKKRIFLISLLVVILACAFAICVSAEDNIIKLDTLPTLDEIHANRSEYVSYVEALEDETTYKADDPNAVIVFSDLAETPTYYVYPAYYLIRSNKYSISPNLEKFNGAIAAADASAFAGYASDGSENRWAKGECDYIIMIEMPKYVTQIAAEYKFEGSANVKEIYFPVHTVIDEETGLEKTVPYCASISGENLFSNCNSLEVIHNMQYLSVGLVQGNNAGFTYCYKLKEFYVPDGVTHIPDYFFKDCDALTELTMPNTLVSVGKQAFSNCDNLKMVRFGASFTTFYSQNNDFETFSSTNNCKYIYLPATTSIFSVKGTPTTVAKNIFSSGKNVTFFFTGTQEQAEILKGKFVTSGANGTIAGAALVEYDPTINYEGYAESLGYSIIVYDYNACKAFYGDNHINTTSYGFDDKAYVSEYCRFDGCERCGDIVKTSYGKLLINKGYSVESEGSGFNYGITFNKEAIATYEQIEKTSFSYGFVAGKITEGDEGKIVNANGEKATDNVIATLFTETEYNLFNVKVTGVDTDDYKVKDVYVSAFIIDGDNVYYIGNEVTDSAIAISYDKIFDYQSQVNGDEE